jgi:hypothetical protein
MISEHNNQYQLGLLSPPGESPADSEIMCLSNQTDFTATRVPGGPEAGRALAFRRPPLGNTTESRSRSWSPGCTTRMQLPGCFLTEAMQSHSQVPTQLCRGALCSALWKRVAQQPASEAGHWLCG